MLNLTPIISYITVTSVLEIVMCGRMAVFSSDMEV